MSEPRNWTEVCAALEAAEAERDQARAWIGKAQSLTERLRANHLDECYEAIDRIETLTAQLESTMRDRAKIIAERDALRATLREIADMARDAKGARAATAKVALGMLANIAEEAANK